MTNYLPAHDPVIHSRLTELFDMAEDAILSRGFCAPDDVEQYLFDKYLDAVDTNMSGCSQYLLTEEQCAGESFVIDLCTFVGKPGLSARAWKMSAQLMCQPTYYFPNYLQMLTTAYLHTLRKVDDVLALRHNGVFLLAAAALPGWYHDARRELRRRGYAVDVSLVADELSDKRVRAIEGRVPVGKKRRRVKKRPS